MAQKRPLDDSGGGNDDSEEKRQRINLQSSALESMKSNTMQMFWVVLEPMLRRVVSEEVERVITKYLPSQNGLRLPSKQLQGPESASLRLQFQNRLAQPLYTGRRVEGENANSIQVFLQDANTGSIVIIEDESAVRLDIVVLEGDFSNDDKEDWSSEEFENYVVKEREGKRPLLTGDLSIQLKQGIATLGEIIFTDNSSWIRSRKFRLGVKIASGCLNGSRVREAKTEPFFVKDHRGQLYKKHYPPNLDDDVWRLEKIGKDGAYHKRLCELNINTVKDFLTKYSIGPTKLREIFGTTMSGKTWDCIIEHAKTCILTDTQHVFYPDESHSIGVILNTIYQPLGIVRDGTYIPSSSLSDTEKVYMDRLVQDAHNDLNSIQQLPSSVKYEDPDSITRSGQASSVSDAFSWHDLQGQGGDIFYENSATTTSTHDSCNALQNDMTTSATGVDISRLIYSNVYSPGTFESLFAYENYNTPNRSVYDDKETRAVAYSGSDEVFLSNVNTGRFSSSAIQRDLINSISTNNHPISLHRRPYIGWIKLKAILKWCYLMKASRRRVHVQQLD